MRLTWLCLGLWYLCVCKRAHKLLYIWSAICMQSCTFRYMLCSESQTHAYMLTSEHRDDAYTYRFCNLNKMMHTYMLILFRSLGFQGISLIQMQNFSGASFCLKITRWLDFCERIDLFFFIYFKILDTFILLCVTDTATLGTGQIEPLMQICQVPMSLRQENKNQEVFFRPRRDSLSEADRK